MHAAIMYLPLLALCAACMSGNGGADQYESQRDRMVDRQIAGRGIRDERVLDAMRAVPRHLFVPGAGRHMAYDDRPLPIGAEQTISQPYIVAFMTEALELSADDRVLEIGTGSGYQAAILGEIVKEVYTIEIVESLGRRADALLDSLGYDNVHVKIGDGYKGWPEHAPFDAVIVTAAPENIPEPLIEQLAEGGRMMIPVGPRHSVQKLVLGEKVNGEFTRRDVLSVRFVPMVRGDDDPGE